MLSKHYQSEVGAFDVSTKKMYCYGMYMSVMCAVCVRACMCVYCVCVYCVCVYCVCVYCVCVYVCM